MIEARVQVPRGARVDSVQNPTGVAAVSTFLWILLGVLYLTALIVLGLATLRKGHTALFFVGIIFPLLWIVGALMEPTPRVAAAEASSNLQRP